MGFFNAEMAGLLDIYQAENNKLMSIYDKLILAGEKNNSFTIEEINEIFRTAHSIKGASAVMGLTVLAELTHKMEDLFGVFRNDPQKIKGHVTEVLDLFFAYSDYVKGETERVSEPDFAQREVPSLIEELQETIERFKNQKEVTAATTQESNTKAQEPAILTNDKETLLTLHFAADCAMPNVRAVVILKQLNRNWKILRSIPEDLQAHDSADIIKTQGFKIIVGVADVESITKALANNTYVVKIDQDNMSVATEVKKKTELKTEPQPKPKPEPEAGVTTDAKPQEKKEERFINIRWRDVQELQGISGEFVAEYSFLQRTLNQLPYNKDLRSFANNYRRLLDGLTHKVSALAMLQFSSMAPKIYRTVRDISKQENKNIKFEIVGENIEIDRNLYDNISNPLLHIVRNSLDHGIESPEERSKAGKPAKGKIVLTLENQGSRIVFRVTDDGRGMNPKDLLAAGEKKGILKKPAAEYSTQEALNLIMEPGFSTAKKITAISGRGVGMDVVNTIAEAYGGKVLIESTPGKGTAISMFMPVSITAVDSLSFVIGPWRCYLPLYSLDKVLSSADAASRLSQAEDGKTSLAYGSEQVGVIDMRERFATAKTDRSFYLVGHSMEKYFCLVVDDIKEQVTAINKALPACFDDQWSQKTCIINGVIDSDGSIGYFLSAGMLCGISNGREESAL